MCNFKMGIRRIGASFAALLMVCCLTVPALAAGHDWPASPVVSDFESHSNCWYVWRRVSLSNVPGFELISLPMVEYGDTDTVANNMSPIYSTASSTCSYTHSDGSSVTTFMYSVPYIPASQLSGYWADFPSFPVGLKPSRISGVVRLYPFIRAGYLSNISDVFSDRSLKAFLTSWPSSGGSSIADHYDHEFFDGLPIYIPSNIFFFGSKTDTTSNHTSFSISGGSNDFWASPSNGKYLSLETSHLSNSQMSSFPPNSTISSSDIGFVFAKELDSGYHPYNSEFNVSDLRFSATLWVPAGLLPSDVQVGDWISKATVEDMQDDLVNEFGVTSDTLKDSKQNFDSWQNSNTIDTDVADTGLNIINALMQNVGQFAFIVSLLCFGAVVLRVLIRKAVEG